MFATKTMVSFNENRWLTIHLWWVFLPQWLWHSLTSIGKLPVTIHFPVSYKVMAPQFMVGQHPSYIYGYNIYYILYL